MWWADVEAIDGRTCKRCKTWKPLNRFGLRARTCRYCVGDGLHALVERHGLSRGIVITDLGRQTLREMEAAA